jgi:hypothetical protein
LAKSWGGGSAAAAAYDSEPMARIKDWQAIFIGSWCQGCYWRDLAGRLPARIENLSTVPKTLHEMLCMSQVALGYESPDDPHEPRAESVIRIFERRPREPRTPARRQG